MRRKQGRHAWALRFSRVPGVPSRQSSTLTTRPPKERSRGPYQFKYHIGNPNAIKKLTINPNVPVNSKTAHPPRAKPGAFDFFEKFLSNSPLCCQFRRSNAPPVRASKRAKSSTLQAC